MAANPDSAPTRQRLLLAGAQVFAEHGFTGTSVRDICSRAGANVAAINYHFGGKEELFAEVLRLPMQRLEASIPVFSDASLPLAEALRHLFQGMLAPLRSGSAEAAAMRVVARSMASGGDGPRPDPAVVLRHHAALSALVARHLPVGADPEAVPALCGALVGMAMHAVMGQMHEGPMPRMWSGGGDDAVDDLAARLARYGAAIIAAEGTS